MNNQQSSLHNFRSTLKHLSRFLDEFGAPLTSFASFLQPKCATTVTSSVTFPRYYDLSPDLIFHIYRFCDAATLFQLVRACPFGRNWARKLFWAHPDIWFCVDARWLVNQTGHLGSAWHCPRFSRHVQQIEVHIQLIWYYFRAIPYTKPYPDQGWNDEFHPGVRLSLEGQVKRFWETLQSSFPAVRHTILSNTTPYEPTAYDIIPNLRVSVARHKPTHITLSLSFLHRKKRSSVSILGSQERLILKNVETARATLGPDFGRQRLLLPPKQFSGPAGMIQQVYWYDHLIGLIWRGTRRLLFDIYDYHHFNVDNPISCNRCLDHECKATFTEKGQWGWHATGHTHDFSPIEGEQVWPSDFFDICCVSTEVKQDVQEKRRELKTLNMRVKQEREEIRKAYLRGRKEETNELMDGVIKQLENDPLYRHQSPATQTLTYARFSRLVGLGHRYY